MTVMTSQAYIGAPSITGPFATMMAVIFAGYLVIGIAMPVLPLHVHQTLGFGTFAVGLVAGSQFGASLVSRFAAGHFADRRGPKQATIIGLIAAAAAGVLYLLSFLLTDIPAVSLAILLAGRAVLGGAESFMISGVLNWGLALAGPSNNGKVMSWVGTAMYIAFAAGAPAGSALYARYGFVAVAVATAMVPLLTLLLVFPLDPVPTSAHRSTRLREVLGVVWLPGLGLALSCVGFGAITTFVVLLFAQRGWEHAWAALTAVSVAFVVGRILFGHLPDRVGGPRIALVCVFVEAAGQFVIWLAPNAGTVFAGAALAGLGYSLVFPGFGVEAVRRAPAENRGLAMGAYTACLDLALGIAGPTLGLLASGAGLSVVFLSSAIIALGAAVVAIWLLIGSTPTARSFR
jgi:MFS family permease